MSVSKNELERQSVPGHLEVLEQDEMWNRLPPEVAPRGPAAPRPPPRLSPEKAREVEAEIAQISEMYSAFGRMILAKQGRSGEAPHAPSYSFYPRLTRAVFGAWGMEILHDLEGKPDGLGFEAIRRDLTGVSPRVLSRKLKILEAGGLVRRDVLDARPVRVAYRLTPNGQTLIRMALPIALALRTLVPPA